MKPFLPNERIRTNANLVLETLTRAAVLQGRDQMTALAFAKDDRPSDVRLHKAIERGAVDFLMTSTSAAFNETTAVQDVAAIVPFSAFKAVAAANSVKVNLETRGASTNVPSFISGNNMKFVPQGGNLPVQQAVFGNVTLTNRKAGTIVVLDRQIIQASNAMALTRLKIEEDIGPSLDSIMFDANADDGVRPAGIRNGISAETSGGANAMIADLTLLASKVAGVAGAAGNVIFVADPATAFKIAIALPMFAFQVVPSAGLAAGTVIALAVNGLAIGAGSTIHFESSDTVAIHMESSAPADIGIVGSPANIVSAPVRSMFQTDCTAIKIIFEADWKLRAANSLSWMTSIAW